MRILTGIKGDKIIWWLIVGLSLFSTLVVYSSSIALAYRYKDGHSEYFLLKHLSLSLTGLLVTYYIHKLPLNLRLLSMIGVIGFLISTPLLIFTSLMGVRSGEAVRWVEVPGLGITIQSSDVAKTALIIFISRNLAYLKNKLNTLKDVLLKIILPTAIICGPILISNFSTAFLLALTIFYLILLSDIPSKLIIKLIGLTLIISILFMSVIYFFPDTLPRGKTWKARIENFIEQDSKNNYQVEQAKIAIANGTLIGKGPGNSAQRAFLPQASSDFIYAIIIEEYGSLVGIMILLIFLTIFFRCIRIAQKADNTLYTYTVMGLSFNLMTQSIINMAVAVNLLPVTGQPLPFISMGGTSLLFSCINIGLIMNISRQIHEQRRSTNTPTYPSSTQPLEPHTTTL